MQKKLFWIQEDGKAGPPGGFLAPAGGRHRDRNRHSCSLVGLQAFLI